MNNIGHMNIAISGASGFIGSALTKNLKRHGHKIIPLERRCFNEDTKLLADILSSCDVIINLAGATINKRWTTDYKKEIINSRITVTRKIADALSRLTDKEITFISASAVGCYPINKISNEDSPTDDSTFLAKVCKEWEKEALKSTNTKNVICRFGVVLSPEGGALKEIMRSYNFKISFTLATGNQPFPWISLYDLTNAIKFIINNNICGIVNIVSPQITTYNNIITCIRNYMPTLLNVKVPSPLLRLFLGEMSTFITGGQNVIPKVLTDNKFAYRYPDIISFLHENIKKRHK